MLLSFAELANAPGEILMRIVERVSVDEFAKALIGEDSAIRKAFYRVMPLTSLKALDSKLNSMASFERKEKTASQRKILDIASRERVYRGFRIEDRFDSAEDFAAFLTWRGQPEQPYGLLGTDVTMCRFYGTLHSEELLADIERKNEAEGMGNVIVPGTNIKLINFSICPTCGHSFSFKELSNYYLHPRPDPTFKNQATQFRADTRVYCEECGNYFLPALVISDGTPKNETQFLCRIQTMDAIEDFYSKTRHLRVLSANENNLISSGGKYRGIRNDTLLKDMESKPTLITNLLQYTPANLALNLIDGSNARKGDLLFGQWN
jgi:ribosomal protein L32